jgi:membrane protein YqaA with SNARE-associated domain
MYVLFNLRAWLLVILLSILGLVTRLALYKLGKGGAQAVLNRFPQLKAEQWERGQTMLEAQGAWIVVLAGVPGLGMVFSTAAGAFGVRMLAFALWVTVGLLARYWVLLLILVALYHLVVG